MEWKPSSSPVGETAEGDFGAVSFEYERLVDRLENIKAARERLEAYGMVDHATEEYRKAWAVRHGIDIVGAGHKESVASVAAKIKKSVRRKTCAAIMAVRRAARATVRGLSVRLGRAVGDGYTAAREEEGERVIE